MFRTEVKIHKSSHSIDLKSGILTIGSCFTENIGEKLMNAYFDVQINPFGVQFNPISIADNLNRLAEGILFSENELFIKDELWSSFSHSTLFSHTDKQKCLSEINFKFETGVKSLKNSDFLLITFGTAWVYTLKTSSKVVNNCHKLPADNFNRYRLEVKSIVEVYNQLLYKLRQINPRLKVIFTVSPVRHWKDGAHENTLSKSTLHLAIDEILKSNLNCSYFPAFELLNDELRDYRFFADDMCHPTNLAVDFIWEKFVENYMDLQTQKICKELENYRLRTNHRSIHPYSVSDRIFKEKTQEVKELLGLKYPYLKDRL